METQQEEKNKKKFQVKKTFKRKYLEKGGKSYYLHNGNKIFDQKVPSVNIKSLKKQETQPKRDKRSIFNKKIMEDIAKIHVNRLIDNNIEETKGKIAYLEKKQENKEKTKNALEEQKKYLDHANSLKNKLSFKNEKNLKKGIENQHEIIKDFKEQAKGLGINFGKEKKQEKQIDYGLELGKMRDLIIELLGNDAKNTNIIISLKNTDVLSNQDEKAKDFKVVIFLKDEHYTIAIKKNDYEFCYFNPLGSGQDQQERLQNDRKQIQQYGFFISPEKMLKFKFNSVIWQDSDDVEENEFCGYYCIVWLFNYLVQDENFKESTEYSLLDQEEMEKINPYYSELQFSFI